MPGRGSRGAAATLTADRGAVAVGGLLIFLRPRATMGVGLFAALRGTKIAQTHSKR